MKSDAGILYPEPAKPLWLPKSYALRPMGLSVYFKTEICDVDESGRIVRAVKGNEGHNEITDFGMDALASLSQATLVNFLHLSDTLGPAKRVLTGGTTISLVITDASNITVTATAGFFLVGDVGNTLSIDNLGGAGQTQELKITGFSSSTVVTCSTRAGAWLPGFVAGTGPFANAGVHFTSVNVLANQFTKFNTYDTTAANNNVELNDSGNSRFIQQRIFLSGAAPSVWTINQLGWSDGNGANNVFGKVNLATPDVVAVGKKYRVTLQFFSAYTPINIVNQAVNWGATIGAYTLSMKQEIIPFDSNNIDASFLRPLNPSLRPAWNTVAHSLQPTKWQGDAGYGTTVNSNNAGIGVSGDVFDSAYVNGQHSKSRTCKWSDSYAITNATFLCLVNADSLGGGQLVVVPNAGTITKPSGFWAALTFQIFWTRTFTN